MRACSAARARALRPRRGGDSGSEPRLRSLRCRRRRCCAAAPPTEPRAQQVWVRTLNKDAALAAVEASAAGLVFDASKEGEELHAAWAKLASFRALAVDEAAGTVRELCQDVAVSEASSHEGSESEGAEGCVDAVNGAYARVRSADESAAACAAVASGAHDGGVFIADCADSSWEVIPAENLVAAAQQSRAVLVVQAGTAESCLAALGALEVGADGVVLRSDDVGEVLEVVAWARERAAERRPREALQAVRLRSVTALGNPGDRVCVDLMEVCEPGEGLLVGSFAAGLCLVHSECQESGYVRSRPFRINAGAVCSYVAVPGGRTAYLSELRAGDEVLVVDAGGRSRAATVGRVKIEKRPCVLLELETDAGATLCVALQNAETVRIVTGEGGESVSVSEVAEGDRVLCRVEGGAARHTGIAIKEQCTER